METNKFNKEQLEKIREELNKRLQTMYAILMDYQMQLKHVDDEITKLSGETKPAESKPA